ncbi:MAG: carboxypeptidase-like regulatory domain-containing protein [Pirellulaceae bacterium]
MLATRTTLCLLITAVVLFALSGCGKPHNLPGETGTVKGQVVYDSGTIPQGSTVVMIHQGSGIPATGLIHASGKFTLQMRNGPDILVGDYDVSIKPPGEIDEEVAHITPATVPEAWNKVPQKYWNAKTSEEKFTISPGDNFYEFTLADD